MKKLIKFGKKRQNNPTIILMYLERIMLVHGLEEMIMESEINHMVGKLII